MDLSVDPSKLEELRRALPERMRAAAREVAEAERQLARVLALRALENAFKPSEIAVVRMKLARAQRDAEDLQRIQSALPALMERPPGRSVRLVPV